MREHRKISHVGQNVDGSYHGQSNPNCTRKISANNELGKKAVSFYKAIYLARTKAEAKFNVFLLSYRHVGTYDLLAQLVENTKNISGTWRNKQTAMFYSRAAHPLLKIPHERYLS